MLLKKVLPLVSFSLFIASSSASACLSKAITDEQGKYSGCNVQLSNHEYVIPAHRASEAGCRQVCEILGEVRDTQANPAAAPLRARTI